MKINPSLCDGCGKCVAECHRKAIAKNDAGTFFVDAALCNNCSDVFDVECARVCTPGAFVQDNGTAPEINRVWRLRSEHAIWLIAILGARGKDKLKGSRWQPFRELIASAYRNPDLQVRLVKNFDDSCIGCAVKQLDGHAKENGRLDDLCFAKLGVAPGTVMRFWDAVQLCGEKFSVPFIKSLGCVPDDVIEDFLLIR